MDYIEDYFYLVSKFGEWVGNHYRGYDGCLTELWVTDEEQKELDSILVRQGIIKEPDSNSCNSCFTLELGGIAVSNGCDWSEFWDFPIEWQEKAYEIIMRAIEEDRYALYNGCPAKD